MSTFIILVEMHIIAMVKDDKPEFCITHSSNTTDMI